MAEFDQTELEDFTAFEAYCQTLGLNLEASPDSTMDPLRAALARTATSDAKSSESLSKQGLPMRLEHLPSFSFRDEPNLRKGLPTAEMTQDFGPEDLRLDDDEEPSVTPDTPPSTPPDFVVRELLGQGGMGVVQSAEQTALMRQVALKRLRTHKASPREVRALLQEALLMGRLEHPNIIPVHGLGRGDDDMPVLVMQRIHGVRWRDMMQDKWHPAWSEVIGDRLVWHINTLRQLCNAVHFAHSQDVVHRDIKPENVMIGEFGEVFLLDWGIGLDLTHTYEEDQKGIAGTPAYMAPEMVKGGNRWITKKTDVYLLGATLHEILMGEPRHQGESLFEVMYSAVQSEPFTYPDTVPKELVGICHKAMHCEPEERYEDVQAFRRALGEFLQRKAARELCDAAASRFATLQQLRKHQQSVAIGRLYRLFHECRFALEQVLEQWEDNPEALALRQEVLAEMVSFELEQRNLAAAEALLLELSPARPALEADCEALALALEAERAENERLRDLARDLDPAVTRRERTIVGVALGLYIFASVMFVSWQRAMKGDDIFTHNKSIMVSLMLLFGVSVATFLWRKTLFRNKFGRQMVHTVWVAVLFTLLQRILGKILNLDMPQIMLLDGLLIAGLATVAGIAYNPAFAYIGLIGVCASFVGAIWYDYAIDVLGIGIIVSLASAAIWVGWRFVVRRHRMRKETTT